MRRFLIVLLCLVLLCAASFAEQYEVFSVGEDTLSDPDPDPNAEPLRYGVCDENGHEIIPAVYESIGIGGDGTSFVVRQDGLWGYIDLSGRWIIEPKFDAAQPFENGRAIVGREGFDASRADGFSDDGTYVLYGVIDGEGREILPMEYENISVYPDGCYELDGKLCVIGESGPVEVAALEDYVFKPDYEPFESGKLAKLDGAPTLTERGDKKHRHPRLDGDQALLPLYAAVVQAVYPETTRYEDSYDSDDPVITCSDAEDAVGRLKSGAADMIFLNADDAAALGAGYECVPVARDALVFAVNAVNPADELSAEELREIFEGRTAAWPDGKAIVAYQSLEGSKEQDMLRALMDGAHLMTPPRDYNMEFFSDDTSNIVYRNLENAIGSSLRFFCKDAEKQGIKLLGVDGVAPTDDNIRSGAYPYTLDYVIVTRAGEKNGNVAQLRDWLLSPQGQGLVEKAGYVAVK